MAKVVGTGNGGNQPVLASGGRYHFDVFASDLGWLGCLAGGLAGCPVVAARERLGRKLAKSTGGWFGRTAVTIDRIIAGDAQGWVAWTRFFGFLFIPAWSFIEFNSNLDGVGWIRGLAAW